MSLPFVDLKASTIWVECEELKQKDSAYTPADVFEKVIVDLRKRFHLFAKLRDSLKR